MENNETVSNQNKNEMPDFTPPEPGEANGWHCWHERQDVVASHGRAFVCCRCGNYANLTWVNHRTLQPTNHGAHYPTRALESGEWQFVISPSTRYVCIEGWEAAGSPPRK